MIICCGFRLLDFGLVDAAVIGCFCWLYDFGFDCVLWLFSVGLGVLRLCCRFITLCLTACFGFALAVFWYVVSCCRHGLLMYSGVNSYVCWFGYCACYAFALGLILGWLVV